MLIQFFFPLSDAVDAPHSQVVRAPLLEADRAVLTLGSALPCSVALSRLPKLSGPPFLFHRMKILFVIVPTVKMDVKYLTQCQTCGKSSVNDCPCFGCYESGQERSLGHV